MRYLLIILCLLMSGCASLMPAGWHLKKAKFHQLMAESKGAKISSDTVFIDRVKEVIVPATIDSAAVKPEIDIKAFDDTMGLNDSLVIAIHEAEGQISRGEVINKEKAMATLKKAKEEIRSLRERLAQGFSKDSVYSLKPDSLTEITVTVVGGLVYKINYKQKERKLEFKEKIPVWVQQAIRSGFGPWHLVAIVVIGLVIGFAIGYFVGNVKSE